MTPGLTSGSPGAQAQAVRRPRRPSASAALQQRAEQPGADAKPRLSAARSVLTPTTSPCRLSSSPPELPGFSGAHVWIRLPRIAETTPAVAVPSSVTEPHARRAVGHHRVPHLDLMPTLEGKRDRPQRAGRQPHQGQVMLLAPGPHLASPGPGALVDGDGAGVLEGVVLDDMVVGGDPGPVGNVDGEAGTWPAVASMVTTEARTAVTTLPTSRRSLAPRSTTASRPFSPAT